MQEEEFGEPSAHSESEPSAAEKVHATLHREVQIPSGPVSPQGELAIPADATGLVLFAQGSGSSRHSPRNQTVAHRLRQARLGTLLFDLLTPDEEIEDELSGRL